MKSLLRKCVPTYLLHKFRSLKLRRIMKYDRKRLVDHSFLFCENESTLQAEIILRYHVLEKGFVMPDFRPAFGANRVQELMQIMREYISHGYDHDHNQFVSALKVLRKYYELHKTLHVSDSAFDTLLKSLKIFLEKHEVLVDDKRSRLINGGDKMLTREECLKNAKKEWPAFVESRCTVRDLLNEEISDEDLRDIVKWAGKSPSACNRQSSRVYVVSNPGLIAQALSLQGGSSGFSKRINKLLIVCSDLSFYDGLLERTQAQIDCGIFLMSLLCGIHYKGLGGCVLHWSVEPAVDIKMRELIGKIMPAHSIMCLIGIGHLRKKFSVAYSQRRELDEVLMNVR